MGCLVEWKCLVACLFFDESQHPTWPHVIHSRKCTQRSPLFRHSSQPAECGVTTRISFVCVHPSIMLTSAKMPQKERWCRNLPQSSWRHDPGKMRGSHKCSLDNA